MLRGLCFLWWSCRGGKGGRGSKGRGAGRGGSQQHSSDASEAPVDMALLTSGLCHSHFFYGSKAFSCEQPCDWQGN